MILEWEVAQLDDELGGVASDVEDLRVADQVQLRIINLKTSMPQRQRSLL